MAENKCIGCDTPIPYGATKCPMCGAPFTQQSNVQVMPSIQQKEYRHTEPAGKICKYCAMKVPKEAKICPFCRKKIGMTLIGKVLAGFAILFLFSFINQLSKAPAIGTPPAVTTVETKPIKVLTGKARAIKNKHPAWSSEDCEAIGNGEIYIGMTPDMVIEAWGKPHRVNTSTGSYGTHEQWVMSDSIHSSYVYFQNGLMTSLQQTK